MVQYSSKDPGMLLHLQQFLELMASIETRCQKVHTGKRAARRPLGALATLLNWEEKTSGRSEKQIHCTSCSSLAQLSPRCHVKLQISECVQAARQRGGSVLTRRGGGAEPLLVTRPVLHTLLLPNRQRFLSNTFCGEGLCSSSVSRSPSPVRRLNCSCWQSVSLQSSDG